MSVEKTPESEHLFSDDEENDNVAQDDINANNTACISEAQKQPTMKELLMKRFSLSNPLTPGHFFDNIEGLKKCHEECGMNVVTLLLH